MCACVRHREMAGQLQQHRVVCVGTGASGCSPKTSLPPSNGHGKLRPSVAAALAPRSSMKTKPSSSAAWPTQSVRLAMVAAAVAQRE